LPAIYKTTDALVRYQIADLDRAIAFYTEHLGSASSNARGPS
jgi:hypothetical protein